MEKVTDSTGKPYIEFGEPEFTIRITFNNNGWNNEECIRIQVKNEKGHLRQGPEIPLRLFGELYMKTLLLLHE